MIEKEFFNNVDKKKINTQILKILGNKDDIKILDMLIGESLTSYEIWSKTNYPQSTAYRKIKKLVEIGLLVEIKKIQGKNGRPKIKYITCYQKLDISVLRNKTIVKIKTNTYMLKKL